MSNSTSKNRVLIVGGGFAGTKAALELSKVPNCAVTLLSNHSHFRYYPALYHAATGGKRAGARIRLENILQNTDVKFVRDTATKLNRDKKEVITESGKTLHYDQLLLALGNVTNYFGIKGLPEYSYGIKSSEEAERFKKHLHEQFIENGCPDLNYVIVGGGPTGIELAGALPGYLNQIMKKHGVKECKLHIEIVEAAAQLLPRMPKDVSAAIAKRLEHLGITVMLGTAVQGETPDMLMAGDKPLKSHTVVWTAGVTTHPFFKDNNFKLTDRGKVEVDEYLQAEPDIFVLGDNANTQFSGMAQTALYDGHFVAHNIKRQQDGAIPEAYVPSQPISVIPVGKNWAAVQWGKQHFNGYIGWILRAFADLIGFHDLESWPKAGEQWLTSMREEELDCPDCDKKKP
ncbi:MAG TPA: NAD(P)/FAD-dependent oxidoreductase [Candidatus Saccharimonadales bacterium]|jgi:NADH dehydrogenase|nr:NAD(P)/FAD-dependent oxidoreductase [Candidatus Saccharimonadales bacterium]